MTDSRQNETSPSNDDQVLAALLSAIQLTPVQHASLANLVGHLQATPQATPPASPSRRYPENPVSQRLMSSPTASGFHPQPNHAALNNILAPFLPAGTASGSSSSSSLFATQSLPPPPPPPTPAAPVVTAPVVPVAVAPAAPAPATAAPSQPPAGTPGGAGPGNLPAQAIVVPVGFNYEVPGPRDSGPYYIVVRGTKIGVFAGWENTAAVVIGVRGTIYSRVASVHSGCVRMNAAIKEQYAALLP